ncbi:hypothetical protein SAMN04487826_0695 [Prevotella sp. khp1]|nr:hypothetical protein SAMN04487826_0695 [Prevotella sp. khp1]
MYQTYTKSNFVMRIMKIEREIINRFKAWIEALDRKPILLNIP